MKLKMVYKLKKPSRKWAFLYKNLIAQTKRQFVNLSDDVLSKKMENIDCHLDKTTYQDRPS